MDVWMERIMSFCMNEWINIIKEWMSDHVDIKAKYSLRRSKGIMEFITKIRVSITFIENTSSYDAINWYS